MKTKVYKQHKHRFKGPQEPKRRLYTKTDEETKKEYRECWDLERSLAKKYKRQMRRCFYVHSLEECQKTCNNLCERLGVRRMPWLYHKPRQQWLEASYNRGKDIVLADNRILLRTLLHELAHYVVFRERLSGRGNGSRGHSKDFLWVLEWLYEMYFEDNSEEKP
jgi:hypothetical protein